MDAFAFLFAATEVDANQIDVVIAVRQMFLSLLNTVTVNTISTAYKSGIIDFMCVRVSV